MRWETMSGQILETLESPLTFEEEEELGNAWRTVVELQFSNTPAPEPTHGLLRY